MTQNWPSVQVTHSANVGLIGIGLFPLGAAFLPALPRGDGVVFSSLRPHLLRPRKVLRRRDDALDGLCDGFDEERRNAHLPLSLAGLVPGPRPPRDGPSGNRRPYLGHQFNRRRAVHNHALRVSLRLHCLSFRYESGGKPRRRKIDLARQRRMEANGRLHRRMMFLCPRCWSDVKNVMVRVAP